MKSILLISLFLACNSCGIKGPPLPPESEEVVKKQKAESVTVNTTKAPTPSSGDSTRKPKK